MAQMKRKYSLSHRSGTKIGTQAELYGMEFYYNRKGTTHPTICSICGQPILKGEMQFEFLAGRVSPHHIHWGCFLVDLARMFIEEDDSLSEAIGKLLPMIVLDRLKGGNKY